MNSFKDWLAEVDRAVNIILGVGINDLPDCPFRDWYDDGLTTLRAARRVVREARGTEAV